MLCLGGDRSMLRKMLDYFKEEERGLLGVGVGGIVGIVNTEIKLGGRGKIKVLDG